MYALFRHSFQNEDVILSAPFRSVYRALHQVVLLRASCAGVRRKTLLKEQLDEVLDTLTEREQKVLRLRFGMNDGRARTLEEVGKEFDVTRERIRQIEAKALRKLRHPSRSRKLRDYLD